jgi:hypothetical protein
VCTLAEGRKRRKRTSDEGDRGQAPSLADIKRIWKKSDGDQDPSRVRSRRTRKRRKQTGERAMGTRTHRVYARGGHANERAMGTRTYRVEI